MDTVRASDARVSFSLLGNLMLLLFPLRLPNNELIDLIYLLIKNESSKKFSLPGAPLTPPTCRPRVPLRTRAPVMRT